MAMTIIPTGAACGAIVEALDLSKPLPPSIVAKLRAAWLVHHVLVFPGQALSIDDLERFSQYFGPFGDDPFIAPIDGRNHVIAVMREADEEGPVFAESWHTDWSFLETPPAGTCLYGIEIPPYGGDTVFANQHLALQRMPDDLRARLENKKAIHSAKLAYAPDGAYGKSDQASRSMAIRPSETAKEERAHPIIRAHPETGQAGIFGCAGYITGFADTDPTESMALLGALYQWQTRDEFQYRHKWAPDMLVMWDNRSVLHMATGGYDGHRRLLYRTTIAERNR